jgi:hypothetical protein
VPDGLLLAVGGAKVTVTVPPPVTSTPRAREDTPSYGFALWRSAPSLSPSAGRAGPQEAVRDGHGRRRWWRADGGAVRSGMAGCVLFVSGASRWGRVLTLPRRRQVATPSGPSRRSLRSLRVSPLGYRIFRPRCPAGPKAPPGPGPPKKLGTSLPPGLPAVTSSAPAPLENNQHRKAPPNHGHRKHRHHRRPR